MNMLTIRRWLQFDMKRNEEVLTLNIVANRRWLQSVRRGMVIALVLLALGVMMTQYLKNARLEVNVARLESSVAALRKERVDLKWRADAFEKEVVDWRHKNGINDEFSQLTPDNQFYEPPQAPPTGK